VWTRGSPGVLGSEGAALEVGYVYNDLASVEAALTRGEAAGDVAAIFVGGCSYLYSRPTVEPTAAFAKGLRALADQHKCLLVVDEIRTNFRVGKSLRGHWADLLTDGSLPAEGSSDASHSFSSAIASASSYSSSSSSSSSAAAAAASAARLAPDLHCLCKALANGHPLAALVGNLRSRDAAAAVTATGTYWLSPAPMAAALATLDVMARDDNAALQHTQRAGRRLAEGLAQMAVAHRLAVAVSGPAAMPFLTFDADGSGGGNGGGGPGLHSRPRGEVFCAAWAALGVWAHPHHNWYLSAAHSDGDVEFALATADRAFGTVAAMEPAIWERER
jgi:glutamate-1-semialdehyde 2,1-aminomutase